MLATSHTPTVIRVLRLRIKDKHAAWLRLQAREVNFVWNFTNMAKSVLDEGWGAFRTMLQYKSDSAGVWFEEVDKRYSTQTCSCCDARTGPTGRPALGVREWTCTVCQASHQRDVNAAKNILRMGLLSMEQAFASAAGKAAVNEASSEAGGGRAPLAEGISVL